MATKAKTVAPAVAAPAVSADMMAQFAAFMAMQAGQKAVPAAKAQAAKADPAAVVTAAIEAAGAKIIRTGKASQSDKSDKMWVDMKVGNVRIQGNAFVIRGK